MLNEPPSYIAEKLCPSTARAARRCALATFAVCWARAAAAWRRATSMRPWSYCSISCEF